MNNQGYPEEKEIRSGKAPRHQAAAETGKKDISNAEIVPNTIQEPALEYKLAGYWTDKTIISELQPIIEELDDHFPTYVELRKIGRHDLAGAISRYGGMVKFQELLGYEPKNKPIGYWTDEIIIAELESIIKELNHFPTQIELAKIKRNDLSSAISQHGGIVKFQELLGYKPKFKSAGYWTKENTISELQPIIINLGHFPTQTELIKRERRDLANAISQRGGSNYFRELLGYEIIKKPVGYWTDETIISELEPIIIKLGHFPTQTELVRMGEGGVAGAMSRSGGIIKFRRLLGFDR